MAQYNIGDKVVLKDDGQVYKVVDVRTEDRVIMYDLEQGDARASVKITVLPSHLEVPKAYRPQQPQVVIYNKKMDTLVDPPLYYKEGKGEFFK